ncbi:MAG: hypothetical protein H0W73_18470 [Bacteroidetes bacterium]|nr:hypothetical protein [Bacteroidota bacterium]
MKSSRTHSVIIVSALLILSSCFLQKRHYMQGYHVSWKSSKHKAKQVEMVGSVKNSIIKQTVIESHAAVNSVSENNEIILASTHNAIDLPKKTKLIIKETLTTIDPAEPIIESDLKNVAQKIDKPDEDKKKSGLGIVPGILLMLLGLLLAGLGYVFYANLNVFIGTFFFLIFGLGGAIFFIIGLVALIVGLVAR